METNTGHRRNRRRDGQLRPPLQNHTHFRPQARFLLHVASDVGRRTLAPRLRLGTRIAADGQPNGGTALLTFCSNRPADSLSTAAAHDKFSERNRPMSWPRVLWQKSKALSSSTPLRQSEN